MISAQIALPRPNDEVEYALAHLGITLARLIRAYGPDTSELPLQWSAEHPRAGQCHVTSLIVMARHGGRIVLGWTADNVLHYWNVVDGVTIDATRSQFPADTVFDRIADATDEILGQGTIDKRDLLSLRAFGPAA